jgi:flavin reductase (DIM6/NTAB) family NADH-FMN oxidoreductase RutF
VRAPRVAASPVHFECVVRQVVDIPGNTPDANTKIVIGEVLVVHIADDAVTDDGRIDVPRLRPLARLGYLDYTSVESAWEQREAGLDNLHHHVEQPPEATLAEDEREAS